MKKLTWKLQENIIDHKCIDDLIRFIHTTDRYTQFTKVRELEEAWSKWQGCKYSVFVNSGSSANLVIIALMKELYKWKNNDEIIVPSITWITDISTLLQLGLKPVFVDVNLEDFSFDYEDLATKITKNTKAIFLTHLLGFPANIKEIKRLIGNKDIPLIEDCCESHGAKIDGIKIGNFGVASSFSFYWGHHMTTVEGGVVCTNDEKIYHLALLKRSHGLARELPKKTHSFYKRKYKNLDFNFLFLTDGFNLRNTELNAVLGLSQIKKLDSYIKRRNDNYLKFIEIINPFSDYLHVPYKEGISSFCLPLIFKKGNLRSKLQKFLYNSGIETRPVISGNLLKQPFLKHYAHLDKFTNADLIHTNGFYIGNNQFVDSKRLQYLKELLTEFFSTV